ncbi:MAG: prolyl oligopeptidase family serine peptidase [Planctomycetaceae bacterium]
MLRRFCSILNPVLVAGAFFCVLMPARADGLQDNIPENVRRIPELGVPVPDDRAASMRTTLSQLQEKIAAIKASNDASNSALLPDVMIFERAVRCALDYNEFFDVKEFDKADELLKEGLTRADQLLAGKPEWITQKGLVVRGYISRIDQTVQPYGLVIPPTYAIDHSVPTRCDIWFHGRGEKLSEVNFLWDRMQNPGEFTPDHTIMLHPYGRYCNAFKFAGEIDVLEALEDVQKRYRIDEDRISVRGFSMGGAACWQFATHYSDRWFAANPGAGFSETPQFLKVFQKEDLKPTAWEQTLWNLYDCDKWALNLSHCPTIAYSGENDSQKQAADVMEEALATLTIPIHLRHVVGRGMGHQYDPASRKMVSESFASLARHGRMKVPPSVHFTTHTLKYNRQHWVTVNELGEHWQNATVDARFDIQNTEKFVQIPNNSSVSKQLKQLSVYVLVHNITDFEFRFAAGSFLDLEDTSSATIGISSSDGTTTSFQPIRVAGPESDGSWNGRVVRQQIPVGDGTSLMGWNIAKEPPRGLRKRHNLQGPIDDAFMDSFIFVRPTGTAANEAVGKWADAELTRAIEHWRRHFRGDARVVNDTDVTDEMIQSANLVLWGDPKSNSVMAKIADKLPIQWSAEKITVGDKSYESANHAPILIHPNPLNLNRYVVLNSSFTFRDYAYLNNARQVPMLPDWAVIDLNTPPNSVWPGKVVAADFFDEQWRLKP